MIDIKISPNRSKTYLLPLLLEFFHFPDNIMNNFINCYVLDKENIHERCIYLLFKYDIKNPEFTKFEYQLSKTLGYERHYDLKNNLILYVLNFPKEYLAEYYHFINGKYSLYQKDAKQIIISNLSRNNAPREIMIKVNQILNKDVKLKLELQKSLNVLLSDDDELGEIMNKRLETININEEVINYL